jgi:integrase
LAPNALANLDAEFRLVQARGGAPALTFADLALAINAWRDAEIDAATRAGQVEVKPVEFANVTLPASVSRSIRELIERPIEVSFDVAPSPRAATIGPDVGAVATAYFAAHPNASRELASPPETLLLVGRLQVAARDAEGWRAIAGFDALMDSELEPYVTGPIAPSLRAEGRQAFASALLEVARYRELSRQRAAAFLRAVEAAEASANTIRIEPGRAAFVPREDDRTIAELIASFKGERFAAHGLESTERKYRHIFTALELSLGADKPIRAVTREDCRRVKRLLRTIPAHMGKRYPGLSMDVAIERAAEDDDAPLLAPNTVNSYLSNLIAMFNFAIREDWLEKNPASGLVDKDLPTVKRRGFEPHELKTIFGALKDERRADSWRFWIFALALYTGARLNEIAQLRKEDVCVWTGANGEEIPYLSLTLFDATGRRVTEKRLKTHASERNVPLHPDLIAAGFMKFVAGASDERLFPDLKPGPNGGYSHDVSKWFGAFLDRVGLSDPALVAHSFRHGWRDAADVARIQDSLTRVLGGWAAKDASEKYGKRDKVPVLAAEIRNIAYGDFSLGVAA